MRALTTDFETPSFAAAPVNDFISTTRAKKTIARISSGVAGTPGHFTSVSVSTVCAGGARYVPASDRWIQ